MAITNGAIEKLEGQISEVATRQRQIRAEIVDLRQTLDNLGEADVSKAVDRAGKIAAEILGRETVLKTLAGLEGNYRAKLEAEQKAERERRKTELGKQIDDYFQEIENKVMEVHTFATAPKLAGLVVALGEVSGQFGNQGVENRLNTFVGGMENLLLSKYHKPHGKWVLKT